MSRWHVMLVGVVLGLASVVAACGSDASDERTQTPAVSTAAEELPAIEPFGQAGVEFTAPDGTVTCSCVLVADTSEARSQGLMNVTDLQGYAGMVFVFTEDVISSFFMRDTPLPLTIGWYRADGSLVSTADMDPCLDGGDCETYAPGSPYRFALEVPRGGLEDLGGGEGATIALVETCET